MQYRKYGDLGWKVSQLGFGCMRLPTAEDGSVAQLRAVRMLRKAYREGVNFYDTAYGYHGGESEVVLGKAVKDFRESIYVSTKNPVQAGDTGDSWRVRLDEQIERLGFAPDILKFHFLAWDRFRETCRGKNGVLKAARKAQDEGLFKELAFSCHDSPANMMKLINTGEFVGILLQYNLLDRKNEEVIDHAHDKGLGVAVMGPVGGGRLALPSERINGMIRGGVASTPEMALRFVLANKNVSVALSGMSDMKQLTENLSICQAKAGLTAPQKRQVQAAFKEIKKLSDLYCTGCGYCVPCPSNVNIPRNFEIMNYYRVWGLEGFARGEYRKLKDAEKTGLQASACKKCGKCEPKCPQNIKIVEQLEEVATTLG